MTQMPTTDMAYDWVCEMLNIDSFVDNKTAWDSFYETWESCDNRNDLNTFVVSLIIMTLTNHQESPYNDNARLSDLK